MHKFEIVVAILLVGVIVAWIWMTAPRCQGDGGIYPGESYLGGCPDYR